MSPFPIRMRSHLAAALLLASLSATGSAAAQPTPDVEVIVQKVRASGMRGAGGPAIDPQLGTIKTTLEALPLKYGSYVQDGLSSHVIGWSAPVRVPLTDEGGSLQVVAERPDAETGKITLHVEERAPDQEEPCLAATYEVAPGKRTLVHCDGVPKADSVVLFFVSASPGKPRE